MPAATRRPDPITGKMKVTTAPPPMQQLEPAVEPQKLEDGKTLLELGDGKLEQQQESGETEQQPGSGKLEQQSEAGELVESDEQPPQLAVLRKVTGHRRCSA